MCLCAASPIQIKPSRCDVCTEIESNFARTLGGVAGAKSWALRAPTSGYLCCGGGGRRASSLRYRNDEHNHADNVDAGHDDK